MDAWLLQVMAEIFAINAEIEGMKALNQYRISRNETIAYDEEAFNQKAQNLWGISNMISRNR